MFIFIFYFKVYRLIIIDLYLLHFVDTTSEHTWKDAFHTSKVIDQMEIIFFLDTPYIQEGLQKRGENEIKMIQLLFMV